MLKTSQEMRLGTRLEDLLAKAGARDRLNIEKHLAALDAEVDPSHASLWRRLMVKLGELAPMPVHSVGVQVVQFYVADGKYRMQVFALEDNRNGVLELYLPNVLAAAVKEKLLVKTGSQYSIASSPKNVLTVQQMDMNNTSDPPDFVKHMMGWNRKAVKLTLNTDSSSSPQVAVAEQLCELAAKQWSAAAS